MCVFKKEIEGKQIVCCFSKTDYLVDKILIDNEGLCIFHSKNEAWKNENNFIFHLEKLICYFEEDSTQKNIFLEDIIFTTSIDKIFSDREFKKDIKFNNSKFNVNLTFKSSRFKNLDFNSAIFDKPVTFSDLSIKGIMFDNAAFKLKLFISDCDFFNGFFMLNTHFDGGFSILNSLFHSNCFFQNIITNMDKSIHDAIIFKNIEFKDFTTFELSEFNSVVDFKNIIIYKELVFHNTQFNYDEPLPIVSSVTFSQINIKEKGTLEFRGISDNKMFNKVQNVSFVGEEIDGKLFFENTDFTKFNLLTRKRLISATKKKNAKVVIGIGCIKYYNQTPLKSIEISDDNQSLVIELCNTFVDYFTKNAGFNLGVEFVSKTNQYINFFYFSDEDISYEKFENQLQKSEQAMWRLIKIDNDNLSAQPPKNHLPSKIINATDTIVNLLGLVLKIGSRIPLGLISKEDILHLVNTTLPSNIRPNNAIMINQIVLFGTKNTQTIKIKKIE
ncbi:hypothetical protein Q4Q35_05775 [Flavivirga aquimarina]|uniref:Uncharacterized protein n=1 Tax=Flavivirga aquimarina TaxID=2027862 RepID=A0ABT8W8A9_9FLAO|nr:hypothetical protein [Flavivirga aquimarina]MDO5969309.1 hypothetical protein [Flavivirga aquimarina]